MAKMYENAKDLVSRKKELGSPCDGCASEVPRDIAIIDAAAAEKILFLVGSLQLTQEQIKRGRARLNYSSRHYRRGDPRI